VWTLGEGWFGSTRLAEVRLKVPLAEAHRPAYPQVRVSRADAEAYFESRTCPEDHETIRCSDRGWEIVECSACETANALSGLLRPAA
jgi:hypothetical protein